MLQRTASHRNRLPAIPALLRHHRAIQRWCLARTGDFHLAEDIAQETLLAAWRQRSRLREPQHLRRWLFRVAQRRLADASRRRMRSFPLRVEPLASEPSYEDPATRKRKERAQALRACRVLRALPLSLRRAVRLHCIEGRPLCDVADRLSTSVNGVKARLYRARRVLRKKGLVQ